jgi:hypothetical protein
METMVKNWTDERLEERFDAIDGNFTRLDADIRELRAEMKAGFDHVDTRFHDMHRTIIVTTCSLMGTMVVGFASILATQL